MTDRSSITAQLDLISDPDEKAAAEARNALRQFDVGMMLLDHWLDGRTAHPNLRSSDLLTLNRFALDGIHPSAGTFRAGPVVIEGSAHQPPHAAFVPELVEDLCDYINANWHSHQAEFLAAYALWRLNWIHPFADGNGRTARIVSYILLCAKLGFRLPGELTIPEQIAADKSPYYSALEASDRAFLTGKIDLAAATGLIRRCLDAQLDSERPDQPPDRSDGTTVLVEGELLQNVRLTADPGLLTFDRSKKPIVSSLERNPVLFTGFFAILAAVLGAVLTILFGK